MTLQQSQKLYALTSTLVPVGSRGVSGVRSALLDTVVDETVGTQGKWKGISTLNNFSYTNNGESMTVWRAYNVRKGKTLQWSKVPGENQYVKIVTCISLARCLFGLKDHQGCFDLDSRRKRIRKYVFKIKRL